MTQSTTQNTPTPEQQNKPEIRAGLPLTDAQKKAEADKAAATPAK